MKITFKEVYVDEEARSGSREVFTAGRGYEVSESFGKEMEEEGLLVEEKKESRRTTRKSKNHKEVEEDGSK